MKQRMFDEVVKAIEKSEIDVDKVLKAARLQRNESSGSKLNAEQKMGIIVGAFVLLGVLGLFAMLVLGSVL